MNATPSGLAKVQSLYVLQVELWKALSGDMRDPKVQKETKKNVKQFEELLKEVDQKYMGGEDVYEELVKMHQDVVQKLKESRASSKTKRGSVKKTSKKK
jgi:hypothetical protein